MPRTFSVGYISTGSGCVQLSFVQREKKNDFPSRLLFRLFRLFWLSVENVAITLLLTGIKRRTVKNEIARVFHFWNICVSRAPCSFAQQNERIKWTKRIRRTIVSNFSTSMCWGNSKQITVTTTTQKYRLDASYSHGNGCWFNSQWFDWIEWITRYRHRYIHSLDSLVWMTGCSRFILMLLLNHAKESKFFNRWTFHDNNKKRTEQSFRCFPFSRLEFSLLHFFFLVYPFTLIGIVH